MDQTRVGCLVSFGNTFCTFPFQEIIYIHILVCAPPLVKTDFWSSQPRASTQAERLSKLNRFYKISRFSSCCVRKGFHYPVASQKLSISPVTILNLLDPHKYLKISIRSRYYIGWISNYYLGASLGCGNIHVQNATTLRVRVSCPLGCPTSWIIVCGSSFSCLSKPDIAN